MDNFSISLNFNLMKKQDWFANWFDTRYYHLLYQNRNEEEAKEFIQEIVAFLKLPINSKVLDLACGKGRHAHMFCQHGMQVLGVDLSPNSIAAAKHLENDTLSFSVHDMREPIAGHKFDLIANLFTSFGYFDTQEENKKMLHAIAEMLDKNGLLLIDFMNAKKVIANLVAAETVQRETLSFDISRRFDGTHIFKDIQFSDEDEDFHYTERVQALYLEDFKALLEADFEILHTFGDFELNAFDASHSDRLILIAKRK